MTDTIHDERRVVSSDARRGAWNAAAKRVPSLILAAALTLATSIISADINLRFVDSQDSLGKQLADYLGDSGVTGDFLTLLNENFDFDPTLDVVFGGEGVPTYDDASRTITLPHSYFADAVRAQAELVDEGEEHEALARGLDVYEYTLYHLLGHALIGEGSEDEDAAVEALSSWIMIRGWPNGGEQWFSDVTAFAEASQKLDGPLNDYWHSHALYRIREETLYCWILGSDPERHADLLPAVLDPAERRSRCAESWRKLEVTIGTMIEFRLKEDAPLRAFLPAETVDMEGVSEEFIDR